MPIKYENPQVSEVNSAIADTVETHPAYAQIRVSRVSGSTFLYGSDFAHQHFLEITIAASELNRGLSEDRPHARQEYIQVALSEAQWANFVASPNIGMGTQCTLQYLQGVRTPQIPSAPKRAEQFKLELGETLKDAERFMNKLATQIENSTMSKTQKREMLSTLTQAVNNLSANVGFVSSQFGEHVEHTVEHAKIEVGAYLQAAVARAGLKALGIAEEPFRLASGDTEQE